MDRSKTLIPLYYFYDPEIFQQEKEKLFSATWVWVGFTDDLTLPDIYISVDCQGKSIVIKNFDGVLKAFLNVCSHRFSTLCLKEKGQGLLQCPYHGWTYDHEGKPYAIPRKKQFEQIDPDQFKLVSFDVDVVGHFVFLKLTKG